MKFILLSIVLFFIFESVLTQKTKTSNTNVNIEQVFGRPDDQKTNDGSFVPSESTTEKFDWDLFRLLSYEVRQNMLISPYSLKFLMALLNEAAGTSKTASEIQQVLKFSPQIEITRNKFVETLKSLQQQSDNYILNTGTKMFLDPSIKPEQRFTSIATQHYKTSVESIDVNSPAKTAKKANDWVKSITRGNIDNFIAEDELDNVVVMLLNAIYFKGTWKTQFAKNDTKNEHFYINSSKSINVPFMTQTNNFQYYLSKALEAKILRMPYMGDRFSMYILLPNALNGIDTLIQKISPTKLKNQMFMLENVPVKVSMPIFQFQCKGVFNGALTELGIRDLFTTDASLPGIAHGQALSTKIYVSQILQKSGIDVNELGSTAYVATGISLVNKFGGEDATVEEFIVDKPFVFYIEDEVTKQILFLGKLENPSVTTADITYSLLTPTTAPPIYQSVSSFPEPPKPLRRY